MKPLRLIELKFTIISALFAARRSIADFVGLRDHRHARRD